MNINFQRKNMNELEKKIIELRKNNEQEKIEVLLKDQLRQDPENIDLLFRLANLELWPPFVNEIMCYIALEKIIVICKKHQTIASVVIKELVFRGIHMTTIKKLDTPFKDILSWFYSGKNPNILYKPINQLLEYGTCDNPEEIKTFFMGKLKQDPYNMEAAFLLALIEQFLPNLNVAQNIVSFENFSAMSNGLEALATIFLAYVKNQYAVTDEEVLVHRLKRLEATDNQINSMIYYAQAWFYEMREPKLAEQYFKESINLCQDYVWNNVALAKLYLKEGRKKEAKLLVRRALQNVKMTDSKGMLTYDLNEFLNECIKGTWLGKAQLESLKALEDACN
jgi:hypothetical protein